MEDQSAPTKPEHIAIDECAQLNAISKLAGWETDYRQATGNTFDAAYDSCTSNGVRFTHLYFNNELMVSATPPAGHSGFLLPLSFGNGGIMQGKPLGAGDAAVISPGSEVFYRSPMNLHLMLVTIPVSRLDSAIRSASNDTSHPLYEETRTITMSDVEVSRLSTQISYALQTSKTTPDQVNVCLHEIEQEVISTLSLAMTNPTTPESGYRGRDSRIRALRRARDYIEANLASPLGLETLSEAVGVSQRTLRTAFHETFSITVVQYIKNRRLIAINRLLLDPQYYVTSVSALAFAHGFNQMGYFAQDYRSLFGEAPSDTLGRKKG